jgi:hypothetical protein
MNLHFSPLLLGAVAVLGWLTAESAQAEPEWAIEVASLGTISIMRTGEGALKASIHGQSSGVGQEVSIKGQSLRIVAIDDTSVTLQHDRELARPGEVPSGTTRHTRKLPAGSGPIAYAGNAGAAGALG